MIVNRDYRVSLARKEASAWERQRLRKRAILVLGMLVLGLTLSGLVRIYHWAWEALDTPAEKATAVVAETPPEPEPEPERPQYAFYEMLPRHQVEITDDETEERPMNLPPGVLEELISENTPANLDLPDSATPSLDAAVDLAADVGQGDGETPRGYLIQAGAFGDSRKAKQMRARIATLGFAARVEPVQVNGKALVRVRLGPFVDPQQVEAMRLRLQGAGIDIDIINRY